MTEPQQAIVLEFEDDPTPLEPLDEAEFAEQGVALFKVSRAFRLHEVVTVTLSLTPAAVTFLVARLKYPHHRYKKVTIVVPKKKIEIQGCSAAEIKALVEQALRDKDGA